MADRIRVTRKYAGVRLCTYRVQGKVCWFTKDLAACMGYDRYDKLIGLLRRNDVFCIDVDYMQFSGPQAKQMIERLGIVSPEGDRTDKLVLVTLDGLLKVFQHGRSKRKDGFRQFFETDLLPRLAPYLPAPPAEAETPAPAPVQTAPAPAPAPVLPNALQVILEQLAILLSPTIRQIVREELAHLVVPSPEPQIKLTQPVEVQPVEPAEEPVQEDDLAMEEELPAPPTRYVYVPIPKRYGQVESAASSPTTIADRLGVSVPTISAIVKRLGAKKREDTIKDMITKQLSETATKECPIFRYSAECEYEIREELVRIGKKTYEEMMVNRPIVHVSKRPVEAEACSHAKPNGSSQLGLLIMN